MLRYISGTAGPGHLIQLKKLTPAVIDGQVIPTSQTLLLDTDAQCVLSGIDRSNQISAVKEVRCKKWCRPTKGKYDLQKTEDGI